MQIIVTLLLLAWIGIIFLVQWANGDDDNDL